MLQQAVLITGAGQRIGFYLAEQFLQKTPYPVVFTYRSFRPGVQALLDQGALGIQVDFQDSDSIEQVMGFLHLQVKSLRAVVHNASLWLRDADLKECPELWQALMAVHVRVPFELNQRCVPLLGASSQADIVHITDCKAKVGGEGYAAYLASKAALSSMTQSFAKTFAPAIKVNEIAPGLILFNEGDDEVYRQQRLAQNAIPIEPGAEVIWQTVRYFMENSYATGSVMELGHLLRGREGVF